MERIQINLNSYRHLDKILQQKISYDPNVEFTSESIKFSNIDFVQTREIDLNTVQSFTNQLLFENCTFNNIQSKGKTIIKITNRTFKSLIFKNCTASALYANNCPAISLIECDIDTIEYNRVQSVEFENQNTNVFNITNSTFSQKLNFDSLENLQRLRIADCNFEDDFRLLNNQNIEVFKIENTTQIKGKTLIKNNTFSSEVEFESFFTQNCSFQNNSWDKLRLNNSTFDDLKISRNTGELSLLDSTLEQAKLFRNSSSHILTKYVVILP